MSKVLIIEDDIELAELIGRWLEKEQHNVQLAHEAADGLSRLKLYHFDLVILDWNLPDGTGLGIVENIRKRAISVPILMLTGRSGITDRVSGLNAGADDFLPKPFDGRELMARVSSLLRRPPGLLEDLIIHGNLTIDCRKKCITYNSSEIRFQPKEYALLEFLIKHKGSYYTSDKLIALLWSDEEAPSRDAVTSCVKRIRRKLEQVGANTLIKNSHSFGYGIVDPVKPEKH